MLSSPAALWIPNAWFLRGWQGCLLPLPALIHYLYRRGTHMPGNTHSPVFNFLLPHRSFQSCWQAWVLSVHATSVSVLLLTPDPPAPPSQPLHCGANPVPLLVAGQQGSWGCRLLFRAAEADMGEEVSNGIGRLGLFDFTSHILLRRKHHWLRNKYVSVSSKFSSNFYWISRKLAQEKANQCTKCGY